MNKVGNEVEELKAELSAKETSLDHYRMLNNLSVNHE
jgi:hypothetical protein